MFKPAFLRAAILASACTFGVATPAVAQQQTQSFNIAAGDLASGLEQYMRQAGVELVYSRDAVAGKSTAGVQGAYTREEALNRLLASSGLQARRDTSGAILVAANISPTQLGAAEAAPSADEEIVVTGTRLRSGQATSPVIEVNRDDIERSGYTSAGEVLRSVPQNFGGGVNETVVGAGGANNPGNPSSASSANLRGLGSDSTLTLVNGHRLAYTDEISAVDVSVIPLGAVQRIDILTDGASAIYGSDAVGGVVNFILRDDFEGVETSLNYGNSTDGGGEQEQAGLLAGSRWNGGGVLMSYDYSHQDPILAGDRSFTDDTAARTALIPETERNSVFVSAKHDTGVGLTLSAQGLYTTRSADSTVDLSAFLPDFVGYQYADVQQFGAVVEAQVDLPHRWLATLSASLAQQSTDRTQITTIGGVPTSTNQVAFDTELAQLEFSANGELGRTWVGPIDVALGGSARSETLSDFQAVAGATTTDLSAARRVESAFGEVRLPILGDENATRVNALSLVLAGRFDHYSDFGGNTISKVGFVYDPIPSLRVRGSWGKSFRAPSLAQLYIGESSFLFSVDDPSAATGQSIALLRFGGNPDLQPEEATTRTLNVVYAPSWLPEARFELTGFDIDYSGRIASPFSNFSFALTDPFATDFVGLNPSSASQAAIIAGSLFTNQTGLPYDPSTVAAIIDDRNANVSVQKVKGVDAFASYRIQLGGGDLELSANASYLNLEQQLTPTAPSQELTGLIFNPPQYRARLGASWIKGGLSASAFVNYTSSFVESGAPNPEIHSWTTADVQLAYDFRGAASGRGLRVALSVQNVFDEAPPHVDGVQAGLPGLHYDSTNASAVGRFVSLRLVQDW